ncbi:unnamed protein product [Orchesella dallaii]|uniref:Amidase domain-containing protein n=1 Tax=Orchesella dallaii TaxID=48710 RepID=A0ABP1QPX7_9HEXA
MITFTEDFKIYVLPWISLVVTGYLVWTFYHHVLSALHDKWTTRRLIKKKQREREYAFQKLHQRYEMTAKAEKIISLTEDQLLSELQQRKLSAIEVLEAFIAKALKETKEYNSVTEFIPQAHLWAAKLDEMPEIKGKLHGLPISVKDNCNVEGMDSTIGFAKNLHKPQDETCTIVKMLMDLGAVPFCKTNVPQTLFCWGSGNPIFGETKNSLNPALGPGGSSSGEGSLIASGGSVFGIGTDAAGSVRIPAHFCGIACLKPTKMRLSPAGVYSSSAAIVGLSGVAGLMGKSASFIKKVFQSLTNNDFQKQYDRLTMPIPWNENLFSSKRPMRIGYYTNLAYFPVLGDTEDVVLKAKSALESAGHSLIPVELPDSFEVMKVFADLVYADGGQFICKIWKDEPVARSAIFHFWMSWIPRSIRVVLAGVMNSNLLPFFYSPRIATMFRGGAEKSSDLMLAAGERGKLLQQMATEWEKHNLDLLLCPTFPFAAVPLKDAGYLKPAIVHTLMWNMFDWPAGVVRFGTESGKKLQDYNTEGDLFLKWAHQAAQQSVGMPISVQLVGLPFQEETVLRGMMELQDIYLKNPSQ